MHQKVKKITNNEQNKEAKLTIKDAKKLPQ